MAFRQDFKHILLMLDVDDTLIDYAHSKPDAILWTGGSPEIWCYYLEALRAQGEASGYKFHFGINTFKPTPDFLSIAAIKELNHFLRPLNDAKGEPNLIYHIGKSSKVKQGLLPAKEKIQQDYKTQISAKDMWLFDDMKMVCDEVNVNHRAVQMPGLNAGSTNSQKQTIAAAFKTVFNEYKLNFTPPTLLANDDEEIPDKTPRRAKAFFETSTTNFASAIHSAAAAAATMGVKGLDDDEDFTASSPSY